MYDYKEDGKSLFAVFIVLCCIFGCNWYNSYNERKMTEEKIAIKRQDSIRKAFIADSLSHDSIYQDSLKKAEAKYVKWKQLQDSIRAQEIAGFVFLGDSVYHSAFHSETAGKREIFHAYSIQDLGRLRFVSFGEIEKRHYKLCRTCGNIEDLCRRYEDGDIIDKDDI